MTIEDRPQLRVEVICGGRPAAVLYHQIDVCLDLKLVSVV